MKLKIIFNDNDERQDKFRRFVERVFPEIISEENPDAYLVVGGDGAMLHAHKHYGDQDKLFIGKSLGTYNFIMNRFNDDFEIIDGLLKDKINPTVIEIPKIKVAVNHIDEKIKEVDAINDIVIGDSVMDYHHFKVNSEMGTFKNFKFKGMGVCTSTPLGSTAFNLNNGGVVTPLDSNLWSITSICSNRRIDEIVKPQKIKFTILETRGDPICYVDGTAHKIYLREGSEVTLTESKNVLKLGFLDIKKFFKRRLKLIHEKR